MDATPASPRTLQDRLASVEASIADVEGNGQASQTRDGRQVEMPRLDVLYRERDSLLAQIASSTPALIPGYRGRRFFVRGRGRGLS